MPGAAPRAMRAETHRQCPRETVQPTRPLAPQKVRADFRDTAFWTATITTGSDGTATVPVPLPDNLTTWRLTAQASPTTPWPAAPARRSRYPAAPAAPGPAALPDHRRQPAPAGDHPQ